MREAIGGTMLMYIVMFFLIIYIFFMAIVINYGRVYRAKNALVSYIEDNEGFKEGTLPEFLKKANDSGYRTGAIDVCYSQPNPSSDTKYFSVRLYITFQLPLVDNAIQIPITGETIGVRNVEENIEGITKCGTGDQARFTSGSRVRAE